MPQCCAVPMCANKTGVHKFPTGDKSRLKQWLMAIRRDKFIPTKNSLVCKSHFKPDDYELPKDSVLENRFCVAFCGSREPFKPKQGTLPFIVYYASRYRGICVGTLVSRTAVLTAAVCVSNVASREHDHRSLTVVVGTSYRQTHHGIRVPVTKVLLPRLDNETGQYSFLLEKSAAILILKEKIPDLIVDKPLRAIEIDWKGEEVLSLHDECFTAGWHFHYRGDKIYPPHRFLLQRHLRVQFLNIMKMADWCGVLSIKFQKSLTMLGFMGHYDRTGSVCIKDPGRSAQPCHGMYGAPLVCKGRVVGLMTAPDAQWYNCTGQSNVFHLLNSEFLRRFMTCTSTLFEPEIKQDWKTMVKEIKDEDLEYDYVEKMEDDLRWSPNRNSDED